MQSNPFCWVFDGAVFSCSPPFQYVLIKEKLLELSLQLDIGLSIKPWKIGRAPLFTKIATELIKNHKYNVAAPLRCQTGKCLYNSVSYLKPGHTHSSCDELGPHTIWDFNNQIFASQHAGSYLYLRHMSHAEVENYLNCEEQVMEPLELICHTEVDEQGHFFAADVWKSLNNIRVLDGEVGVELTSDIQTFLTCSTDITFFCLVETDDRQQCIGSEEMSESDDIYKLQGCGRSISKS